MPPRKRHAIGKNNQESKGSQASHKARDQDASNSRQQQQQQRRVSPTLMALCLVLLVGITSTVYVVNFVDVSDVIVEIQTRVAELMGESADTAADTGAAGESHIRDDGGKDYSTDTDSGIEDTKEDSVIDSVEETTEKTEPGTAEETVAETVAKTVAETETVVETVAETVTETVEETVAETVEEKVPETVTETVPETLEGAARDSGKDAQTGDEDTEEKNADKTEEESETVPKTEENATEKKESTPEEQVDKDYKKADITNVADYKIRDLLDEADSLLQAGKRMEALEMFETLLIDFPHSPRANVGLAQCLDQLAEQEQSNAILEQAIEQYLDVLELADVPKPLMLTAGARCANRQGFRGWSRRAAKTVRRLIEMFPDEAYLWNDLGVRYLMNNKYEDAREAFKQVLRMNDSNGFAKVHLGFILKTRDSQYEEAIGYLAEGIATGDPGVTDGRFYFHLGDALQRMGKKEEAYKVYKEGEDKGLFMSMWQRSLYNVESLAARPWWTYEQTGNADNLRMLEEHWEEIRDEGLAQLNIVNGSFLMDEENLRESGDWKQFTLYQQGRRNEENCEKAPKTCELIAKIPDAAGCKRGQVKFSVMQPGTHVWPHCGPTNCRIRAHLGLVIPDGVKLRVLDDIKTWKEGSFVIFDDSFEHEVWHEGDSLRMVLIMDMWHPELTAYERHSLSAI